MRVLLLLQRLKILGSAAQNGRSINNATAMDTLHQLIQVTVQLGNTSVTLVNTGSN
jgi:hypothetical protein